MKRFFALFLCFTLFCLSACGVDKGGGAPPEASTPVQESTASAAGENTPEAETPPEEQTQPEAGEQTQLPVEELTPDQEPDQNRFHLPEGDLILPPRQDEDGPIYELPVEPPEEKVPMRGETVVQTALPKGIR